jgi:hypothetical protein
MPTLEGEGRHERRREAQASASYKPPPAEEQEDEGSLALAVQPPERTGVNQDFAQVTEDNEELEDCYDQMVSMVRSIKKIAADQKILHEDADRRRDWSSVGAQIKSLQRKIDYIISRYDSLSSLVDTLRLKIRTDSGCPVEPPPVLAAHPSSLTLQR